VAALSNYRAVMNHSLCMLCSTSSDEHLFELVLPKPCSVGHIDVKFCFNSLCTAPPNIQVTADEHAIFFIICVVLFYSC